MSQFQGYFDGIVNNNFPPIFRSTDKVAFIEPISQWKTEDTPIEEDKKTWTNYNPNDISKQNKSVIEKSVEILNNKLSVNKFLTYQDLFYAFDEVFMNEDLKHSAFCFLAGDKDAWKKHLEELRLDMEKEVNETEEKLKEYSAYLQDLRDKEEAIDYAIFELKTKEPK